MLIQVRKEFSGFLPWKNYDSDWQEIIDYTLEVLGVDSEMDEDYAKEWKSEDPDMAEDGLHFIGI